jgi:hypothetical protein
MTYAELITDLGVGLELPVVRTASMTADQSAVLVFYRVLTSDVGIYDGP